MLEWFVIAQIQVVRTANIRHVIVTTHEVTSSLDEKVWRFV